MTPLRNRCLQLSVLSGLRKAPSRSRFAWPPSTTAIPPRRKSPAPNRLQPTDQATQPESLRKHTPRPRNSVAIPLPERNHAQRHPTCHQQRRDRAKSQRSVHKRGERVAAPRKIHPTFAQSSLLICRLSNRRKSRAGFAAPPPLSSCAPAGCLARQPHSQKQFRWHCGRRCGTAACTYLWLDCRKSARPGFGRPH